MSYILDALKKSESERQNQDLPDINAIHQRPQQHPDKKRRIWPLAIPVILTLNIAGLWLIWEHAPAEREESKPLLSESPSKTDARSTPATTALETQLISAPGEAKTQPTSTALTKQSPPVAEAMDVGEASEVLITPADAYRRISNKPTAAIERPGQKPKKITAQPVSKITTLPTNIQRQIPDLTFSSHLYADDRTFRMVNINGNMYHEGDMIAEGIRLERISEEGVVLNYLHYTFEISVIRDWSFQ